MKKSKDRYEHRRNRHNSEMKKRISKKVEQSLNEKFYKEHEFQHQS